MNPPPGPYCNDDGDWWVPVEGHSFVQARALIVGCLSYEIPRDGTLVYRGKGMWWLDSEHEGYCSHRCKSNRHRYAWHFEENRR